MNKVKEFFKENATALMTMAVMALVFLATSDLAYAIDPSTWNQNTFGYTVYDLAVNRMLQGPVGFVAGCGAICVGAVMALKNAYGPAVGAILGGGVLLKADTLTASLGMLIG